MLSLNFNPFPRLETPRLLLSSISPDDASALFALRSNSDVMRYLDRPLASSVDEVLALIELIMESQRKNDAITWGIFSKENATVLRGTIGFWRIQKEHYRAEIGYMLEPGLQGRGLATEAMQTVLAFGFQTMKLHSVEANVNPRNAASIRLLEKNGFVREAYFRENYYYAGRFLDSAIYSLLAPSSPDAAAQS